MSEWRREPPREDVLRQLEEFRQKLPTKLEPLQKELHEAADGFLKSVNALAETMAKFGRELDETLCKLRSRIVGLETLSLIARQPVCHELTTIDPKCMLAGLDDGVVVVYEPGDIEKLTLKGERVVRLARQSGNYSGPTCVAASNGKVFLGLAQGQVVVLDGKLQQIAMVQIDQCMIRRIIPTFQAVFVSSGYHVSSLDHSWNKQQSITIGQSQLLDALDDTLLLGVNEASIGLRRMSSPLQTERVCEFAPYAALLGESVLVAGPKIPGVATWTAGAGAYLARFDVESGAIFAQRDSSLLAIAWPGQLRLVPLHRGGGSISVTLSGRPVRLAWAGATLLVLHEDGRLVRVSNKYGGSR